MAQDTLDKEEEAFLRSRKANQRESALLCEDCGVTIPEPRRIAVKGVQTCVKCQEEREK